MNCLVLMGNILESRGYGKEWKDLLARIEAAESRAEDSENQCSSMVSARDLEICNLRARLAAAKAIATDITAERGAWSTAWDMLTGQHEGQTHHIDAIVPAARAVLARLRAAERVVEAARKLGWSVEPSGAVNVRGGLMNLHDELYAYDALRAGEPKP